MRRRNEGSSKTVILRMQQWHLTDLTSTELLHSLGLSLKLTVKYSSFFIRDTFPSSRPKICMCQIRSYEKDIMLLTICNPDY